jgi:hypothetical protein
MRPNILFAYLDHTHAQHTHKKREILQVAVHIGVNGYPRVDFAQLGKLFSSLRLIIKCFCNMFETITENPTFFSGVSLFQYILYALATVRVRCCWAIAHKKQLAGHQSKYRILAWYVIGRTCSCI